MIWLTVIGCHISQHSSLCLSYSFNHTKACSQTALIKHTAEKMHLGEVRCREEMKKSKGTISDGGEISESTVTGEECSRRKKKSNGETHRKWSTGDDRSGSESLGNQEQDGEDEGKERKGNER